MDKIDSKNSSTPLRLGVDFFFACERTGIAPTQFILTVDIARQTVSLFENSSVRSGGRQTAAVQDSGSLPGTATSVEDYRFVKKTPCSTSRFGIGQNEGSNCTPLGLHRIAEKIGAGERAGAVFKARKVIGHTSQPEFADAKITTRILWLEGLEPGLNKGLNSGVNVDSHARYIYIHGTADQSSIGQPTSCGCIHLADADLIPLFDLLPGGTLVWIFES
jgi:lipoprotein-anchoring transpeptidase ErfK/SrfK